MSVIDRPVMTAREVQAAARPWTEPDGTKRIALPPGSMAVFERWWQRAATALARLPRSPGPSGFGSAWPEVVQCYWDTYGREAARAPRVKASPADISCLDALLALIVRRPEPERVVLFLRLAVHPVSGEPLYSWRGVGRILGCRHETAKVRFDRAWRALLVDVVRLDAWPMDIDGKNA